MGESDVITRIEANNGCKLFKIEQSEDKGRYLVATRDIKPLELIIRYINAIYYTNKLSQLSNIYQLLQLKITTNLNSKAYNFFLV